MDNNEEILETGCCPRFNPDSWDEKEMVFTDRLFVKDKIRCFFHIPLNFGSVMKRNMDKINKADALDSEYLMLTDDKSLWRTDIYIAATKDVPDAEMARISGTFLTKVFEGPYRNVGKWIKEMKLYVASKNKGIRKLYTYYTTCPSCAKAYGKNYIVLMAMV